MKVLESADSPKDIDSILSPVSDDSKADGSADSDGQMVRPKAGKAHRHNKHHVAGSILLSCAWELASVVSHGLPWYFVVSCGLMSSPVVSRGLPWSPCGLLWSHAVTCGLPWSPVVSRDLPWFL